MSPRGNRLFIYQPMLARLIDETNIKRASKLIVMLDVVASCYGANVIKDKKISEISERTGISQNNLRTAIPLWEKAGLITREYTSLGKRTIAIHSQRKKCYGNYKKMIVIKKDNNDIEHLIALEYTKYMLKAQEYNATKASDCVKGGIRLRRKKNVEAKTAEDTIVKVTDKWLSGIWGCSINQANEYKRWLKGRGFIDAVVIIKFICSAQPQSIDVLRDFAKGHAFIKDGRAYDKLGTELSFNNKRKNNSNYLPYCKHKII